MPFSTFDSHTHKNFLSWIFGELGSHVLPNLLMRKHRAYQLEVGLIQRGNDLRNEYLESLTCSTVPSFNVMDRYVSCDTIGKIRVNVRPRFNISMILYQATADT